MPHAQVASHTAHHTAELRQRAEDAWHLRPMHLDSSATLEHLQRLVHELQVHQIELEMQNEELRRVQEEFEVSRDKYLALYDLAPAGYLTLNSQGLILGMNLAMAALLGVERASVVKLPLTHFIIPEDRPLFDLQRQRLHETGIPQVCELRLVRQGDGQFWATIKTLVRPDIKEEAPSYWVTVDDISAFKQVEGTLRATHVSYRALFESSLNGILLVDPQTGGILAANPEACRLLGYTEAVLLAMDRSAIVDTSDDRLAAALQTRARTGIFRGELTYRRADGTLFPVEVANSLIVDPNGRTVGAIFFSDITERKEVEAALRIQRDVGQALSACDQLDEALELILDAALRMESLDCGGVYLADQNDALHLIVHRGLPPQFVNSKSHYDAGAPQTRLARHGHARYGTYQDIRSELNATSENEGLHAAAIIPVLHQGQLVAVLNLASHTHDEIPMHTRSALETLALQIGSAVQRLRADDAVRTSRQNLRALFDTVNDFVFVLDGTGCILEVNAVVLDRLGYTPQELVGQDVLLVHPAERRNEAATIIAGMLADQCEFCLVPIQAKDGTLIPVETHVSQGKWDGRPALFGVSRDITERQRQEQRDAERSAQLETALADLKRAEQAKDEFLAAVSHELRTPLTGVLGMADVLEDQYGNQMDERQLRYVRTIHDSGDRLLAIVNSLLHYTGLIAGNVVMHPEPCSLSDLCAASLHAIRAKAEHKGLAVAYAMEPGDLEIVSDGSGISQLLHSLLDNAVKFTPQGGCIGLTVSRVQGEGTVRLAIWDTGIGIAPADQARIFQPFVQADSSLSRRYEGIGLGLPSARRMVELLGGTLSVESALGKGSRFIVTLPC